MTKRMLTVDAVADHNFQKVSGRGIIFRRHDDYEVAHLRSGNVLVRLDAGKKFRQRLTESTRVLFTRGTGEYLFGDEISMGYTGAQTEVGLSPNSMLDVTAETPTEIYLQFSQK